MFNSTIKVLLLLTLSLSTSVLFAQTNFTSSIGARFGRPLALSYKMMISEIDAIEVYGSADFEKYVNSYGISAAYQRHFNLGLDNQLSPLNWYVGAGPSVYFYNFDDGLYGGLPASARPDFSTTVFGINGYLGLQYTFADLPVEASVDWVPSIYLGDGYGDSFSAGRGALSIRYILNR